MAVILLAQRFPEFQVLEYAKWGLVAWLAVDIVVSVLPAGWLVRTPTPARGWASRLFDELHPERDDRIWSPEQLAAIKASMEAGEPHRFNLIAAPGVRERYPADYIGEFKPRALEEMTPIPELAIPTPELPDPPDLADAFAATVAAATGQPALASGMAASLAAYAEFAGDDAHLVSPDLLDFGLAPYHDDPPPETGHESEILATTTLPTGSDFTQEAHSGIVSGDSQLLDKERDAWGNEVHGAVKALVMGPERLEVHVVGPLQWGGDDELERLMAEASGTGMILTSPPAGPVRVADGLHPTDLRQRREQRQSAYWRDRITQLDPDLMDENNHSGPAEVVRALFRAPDGLDEEGVRRTVTTLAHEVASFTPPLLARPMTKDEAMANAAALTTLADVRVHAHRKVEAIGNVAIALAQANARLRTQAIAHFGQRLHMDTRGSEHSTVEVDDNPAERFAAMSRDEAFAICERMGWIRPALGDGYRWVED